MHSVHHDVRVILKAKGLDYARAQIGRFYGMQDRLFRHHLKDFKRSAFGVAAYGRGRPADWRMFWLSDTTVRVGCTGGWFGFVRLRRGASFDSTPQHFKYSGV